MADDRFEARTGGTRPLGTWTMIFRGFQVAADVKKLLLAAGGILTMAFSWWLLAVMFSAKADPPKLGDYTSWEEFKAERYQWNLRHETAGAADNLQYTDAGDLASSRAQYDEILEPVLDAITRAKKNNAFAEPVYKKGTTEPLVMEGRPLVVTRKPSGRLRTWPWFEDRGPNPYLMVTGQAGRPEADGTPRYAPWDRGHFFDWLTTRQLPVLLEPLVKFARPVLYLLKPDAGFLNKLYFLLVIIATMATWSLFGGAITRMAAVQVARKEKIGLGEALRFARSQWKSYLLAGLFPLVVVAFLVVCCILFWLVGMIPILGELVAGLLWFLIVAAGLIMAIVLIGYLAGWPLIQATISTEGSDSFDALSRTYSYVCQSPWNYMGYSLLALGYGMVVIFFVSFLGSLSLYLGKWGTSQTPFSGPAYTNREPSFLFVYAPTSYGWRELMLQGAVLNGERVVDHGVIQDEAYGKFTASLTWYNYIGVGLVSLWTYAIFLLVIGFGYSYFWSASTIIYLLMRNKVDDTDLDEVYLEEEEAEDIYTPPPPMESAPAKPGTTPLTMVEPPPAKPATPVPTAPPEISPAGGTT